MLGGTAVGVGHNDAAHRHAAQPFAHQDLLIGPLCSDAHEQTDQKPPHSAGEVTGHPAKGAERNERDAETTPDPGGDARGPAQIALPAPERSPQDAPADQGESRHQIDGFNDPDYPLRSSCDDDPVGMGRGAGAGIGEAFGQAVVLVTAVEAPGEAGKVALGVLGLTWWLLPVEGVQSAAAVSAVGRSAMSRNSPSQELKVLPWSSPEHQVAEAVPRGRRSGFGHEE